MTQAALLVEPSDLMRLESVLGHVFSDPALVRRALTHRSHGQDHNERLEFLGDGLLNLVAAELLYRRFGQADEGQLSRMRSHLVRQDCLARIGLQLGLPDLLWLGDGERRSGGAARASILADAVEAIFGAVYLDAGFAAAARVVSRLLEPMVTQTSPQALGKDAKTRLQEHLQARRLSLPVYRVMVEGGTAQSAQFVVECEVEGNGQGLHCITQGRGTSRRLAEQMAAQSALERLFPDSE